CNFARVGERQVARVQSIYRLAFDEFGDDRIDVYGLLCGDDRWRERQRRDQDGAECKAHVSLLRPRSFSTVPRAYVYVHAHGVRLPFDTAQGTTLHSENENGLENQKRWRRLDQLDVSRVD